MSEDKTIVKQHRRKNFTVIDNSMLHDPDLSWQETGMMAYLLSLPNDWAINTTDLVKRKTNGRDSVRALYRSLERKGYLQFTLTTATPTSPPHQVIHVFEQPMQRDPAPDPRPWKPGAGNPGPGKPGPLVSNYGNKYSSTKNPPNPPAGGTKPRGMRICDTCHEHGTLGTDIRRYERHRLARGEGKFGYIHTTCSPVEASTAEEWQ